METLEDETCILTNIITRITLVTRVKAKYNETD
jgi:hypothetical protein